jgi:putative membrane protein
VISASGICVRWVLRKYAPGQSEPRPSERIASEEAIMNLALLFAALSAVSLVATAVAADVPSLDLNFATTAAEAGAAEITEAQLALKKSQRPDVREFAQNMVRDQSAANGKLAAIAKQLGVQLPAGLSADDQKEVATLDALPEDAFDQAYIGVQIAAHDSAVSLFASERDAGEEQHLKAFASSTLPVLKSHQKIIKEIAAH